MAAMKTVLFLSLLFLAALEAGETSASEPLHGLLLKQRGLSAAQPAPLLETDVEIRVTGHVARAKVTQRFLNPHPDWYEGTYVFPLPENAAVDRLRMKIGERIVEGEVREKDRARRTYAEAKAEGRRAALLEQERPNIFTSSVANIAPGEEIRVEIEYQQTLRYDRGRYSLRFPMVVGPRYLPAGMDPVDAARITPAVLRPDENAAIHNPVNLRVEVQAGVPIAALQSPSHALDTGDCGASGCRAVLRGPVPANKDFVLDWTLAPGAAPAAALISEEKDARHYGLVMVVPPALERRAAAIPREAIFIIDTSGSMQGASIAQAREALELAIRRLAATDRFNVIEFNSYARSLYAEARPATPDNVASRSTAARRRAASARSYSSPTARWATRIRCCA